MGCRIKMLHILFNLLLINVIGIVVVLYLFIGITTAWGLVVYSVPSGKFCWTVGSVSIFVFLSLCWFLLLCLGLGIMAYTNLKIRKWRRNVRRDPVANLDEN